MKHSPKFFDIDTVSRETRNAWFWTVVDKCW